MELLAPSTYAPDPPALGSALADLLPDGVLLCEGGRVTYANAAAARLLGHAGPAALDGRPLAALTAEADRIGPGLSPVVRFGVADGGTVRVEVRAAAAGPGALALTLRPAARATAGPFAALFHALPVGLARTRLRDGFFLDANEALATLFGHDGPEDLIGRTAESLGLWATDDVRRGIFRALLRAPGRRLSGIEAVGRTRSGAPCPVVVSLAILEEDGVPHIYTCVQDLSGVRRAEAAAAAERDFALSVMGAMGQGLVVSDAAERFAYVNPAYERAIGQPAAGLLHEDTRALVHPDDRALVEAELARRRAGESSTYELRMRHADGHYVPFLVTSVPRVGAGGWAGAITVMTDLTEQKAAEAEVARLTAFYENILAQLPVQVAVFDPASRFRYLNPAAVRNDERRAWAIGHTEIEYAEQFGHDPAVFARRAAHHRAAVQTGTPQTWDETMQTPGGPRHFHRCVSPLRRADGTLGGVLGFSLDVTDRVEADLRLRATKAYYEGILDRIPIEVFTINPDGTFGFVNPASLSDQRFRPWLVGKRMTDYALARGYDPAPFRRRDAWIAGVLASKTPGRVEERLELPDRPPRDFEHVLTPVLDEAGEVVHLIGYGIDQTERRRYERELVSAKERAEELVRLKGSFLANMSHEIRTPLAGIIGFAEVLVEEVGDDHREAAELIRQSGVRLLDTLNSVLDLARLEANAVEVSRAPLDVATEVAAAADLFRPAAERKGLRFETALAPTPAVLDAPCLHRIATNLLSNAIKFTDAGTVAVAVHTDRDGAAVLTVSDTGAGVDPRFVPHLFDEFRQESTGLTRTHQGAGLGLAITRRLVGLMGGAISVESAKGRGTTFTVRFPAR